MAKKKIEQKQTGSTHSSLTGKNKNRAQFLSSAASKKDPFKTSSSSSGFNLFRMKEGSPFPDGPSFGFNFGSRETHHSHSDGPNTRSTKVIQFL
jgi:hypothetical protein